MYKSNEINAVRASQSNPTTSHISTTILDAQITAKTNLLNGVVGTPGLTSQKLDIDRAIAGGINVAHPSVSGIDAQML